MTTATAPQARGRIGAQAEALTEYGANLFEDVGMFPPVTRLRKIAREGLRTSGYARAKANIVAFYDSRYAQHLASYEKALKSSSIKNIAYPGEKKNAPAAGSHQREGEDRNHSLHKKGIKS